VFNTSFVHLTSTKMGVLTQIYRVELRVFTVLRKTLAMIPPKSATHSCFYSTYELPPTEPTCTGLGAFRFAASGIYCWLNKGQRHLLEKNLTTLLIRIAVISPCDRFIIDKESRFYGPTPRILF